MAIGKQLVLCVAFLGAYSSLSMCMFDFDALPVSVQEEIISYLPADNLYRALWSRSHNASQDFYDDIIKAYVESHFVPQELIDKAITQDFTNFKGSEKQKQEFHAKIKTALNRYNQRDTQQSAEYRQLIAHRNFYTGNLIKNLSILGLLNCTHAECRQRLQRLQESGEYVQVKKQLQKYRSYVKYCLTCLPLTKSKALFLRIFTNEYIQKGVTYSIGAFILMFPLVIVDKYILRYMANEWTKPALLATVTCVMAYSIVMYWLKYISSAFDRLESSFDYYTLTCTYALENLYVKIVRVLTHIDQLEEVQ